MKATVIADASFCPKTKAAGWAAWISHDKGRVKRYGTFKKNPKHSGEAELWALINGIIIAVRAGAKLIVAQSDCQSALDAIKNNPSKVYEACSKVGLTERPRIHVRHVEGHTTHSAPRYFVNRWCDERAGAMMRTLRGERSGCNILPFNK